MKRILSLLLAIIICFAAIPTISFADRDVSYEESLAQQLKDLGLFKGVSDTDFDLERAPSRVEALVMLIRTLGKENDALNGTWRHPFDDVPKWADKYVGYAYVNSLTNGQSATKFGSGNANAAMFVTFVLRALGYSDTNGEDFVWSDPFTLAKRIKIVDGRVNLEEFWRSDVVLVAHAALTANIKDTPQTLAQRLISQGVFTQEDFDKIYSLPEKPELPSHDHQQSEGKDRENIGDEGSETQTGIQKPDVLLAQGNIYEHLNDTMFEIKTYDENKNFVTSGLGVFIGANGVALTNYAAIEKMASATVKLAGSNRAFSVVGVCDYSVKHDWAIIKVDISGNNYLALNTQERIREGDVAYLINALPEPTLQYERATVKTNIDNGEDYVNCSFKAVSKADGGIVLDEAGRVLGIASSKFTDNGRLDNMYPAVNLKNRNKKDLLTEEQWDKSIQEKATSLIWDFVNKHSGKSSYGWSYYKNEKDLNAYYYFYARARTDKAGTDYVQIIVEYYQLSETAKIFSFDIYPGTFTVYASYVQARYHKDFGYTTQSEAQTSFDARLVDDDFRFEFTEYSGKYREKEQESSVFLLEKGLKFVNKILVSIADESGVMYTLDDLGFTSFSN